MKPFYLRLTQSDLTQSGEYWLSGIVDLYDTASADYALSTPSYRNFSTLKSKYGTNLTGKNIWTGIDYPDDPDDLPSDASPPYDPATPLVLSEGVVEGDRFIDTTARIDILAYEVSVSGLLGTATVTPSLDVYTSPNADAMWEDEWASKRDITQHRPILVLDADRYARFNLKLVSDQDLTGATIELLIRVSIGPPIMSPWYDRTKSLQRTFPDWMDLREYDREILEAENVAATPDSVGGQFLNAIAGEWLDDLFDDLDYYALQRYISTADENQTAWVWVANNVPNQVWQVQGDGEHLANTGSLREFYELRSDEDGYWWDRTRNVLYTNREYTTLHINQEVYRQDLTQVWNWFDEFGLIVDLERLHREPNSNFKQRILDAYQNKPGVGLDAFKLALRRELDLWRLEGATPNINDYHQHYGGATPISVFAATPDSDFAGATPEVLEISDLESTPAYTDPERMPTQRFKELVEHLAKTYPVTWGFFRWGDTIFDVGGLKHEGFSILPERMDATPVDSEYLQAGVGDLDDLFVYRPDAYTGAQEFNASFKVRGREVLVRDEYPEVTGTVEVFGRAPKVIYDNPEVGFWVAFEARGVGPYGVTVIANHYVTLTSDISADFPSGTTASWEYGALVEEGLLTKALDWKLSSGEDWQHYVFNFLNDDAYFDIDIDDVSSMFMRFGRYDFLLQRYVDWTTQDIDLWAADDSGLDPSNYPGAINGSTGLPETDTVSISLNQDVLWAARSNETSSSLGTWESDPITVNVTLNGAPPSNSEKPFVLNWPPVQWDPNREPDGNREWVIRLKSFDAFGVPGFRTANLDARTAYPAYVYPDNLYVDGSNDWVTVPQPSDIDPSGTYTTVEWTLPESQYDAGAPWVQLTTGNDGIYPPQVSYSRLFEATNPTSVYGVVDQNGPWRNGQPAAPGNTNFHLQVMEFNRDDFGVIHDPDWIITWMGVESDNDDVITWIDSNTVEPYEDQLEGVTYPAQAINELAIFDEGGWTTTGNAYLDPEVGLILPDNGKDGHYASVPHGPEVSITGDIDIVLSLFPDSWGTAQTLVMKSDDATTPTDHAWALNTTGTSELELVLSEDGTTLTTATSSVAIPFAGLVRNGVYDDSPAWEPYLPGWVRATWRQSDGRVQFFVSYNGSRWTQVGTDQTIAISSIHASTQDIVIGAATNTGLDAIGANIYRFLLRYEIGGTPVVDADFRQYLNNVFTARSGQLVTIHGASSLTYYFDSVVLRARLKNQLNKGWHPKVNSGVFFQGATEYYLYADPITESATTGPWVLEDIPRQGAPVIVKTETATPEDYRRVAFHADGATALSLTNTETVKGTGQAYLFAGFEDLFDITVVNKATNQDVTLDTTTVTNKIAISETSDWETEYLITYKLTRSFAVDTDYVDDQGQHKAQVLFSATPDSATPARIYYEDSRYDPAVSVDLDMHPFYTSINEGFIFLSNHEYQVDTVDVRVSPQQIVADGEDFLYVTVRSFDEWGNPKPYQDLTLTASWGWFPETATGTVSLQTDTDGFASAILVSEETASDLSGTITVSGSKHTTVDFQINPIFDKALTTSHQTLLMRPNVSMVKADGNSLVEVQGRILDVEFNALPNATVTYRRARNHYEMFQSATTNTPGGEGGASPYWDDTGLTVSDASGNFVIGPFQAATPFDPGYWFLVAESYDGGAEFASPASPGFATPEFGSYTWDPVGDVVSWLEYPDPRAGVNTYTQLQQPLVQSTTPQYSIPEPSTPYAFPIALDGATPTDATPSVDDFWNVPPWYAQSRYDQYQAGKLGSEPYEVDFSKLQTTNPERKDV